MTTDKFGVQWDLLPAELCSVCGQPDNCGDCNHEPLTDEEVERLGGIHEPPTFDEDDLGYVDWEVTFRAVVKASSEDGAIEQARELIHNDSFEPLDVHEMHSLYSIQIDRAARELEEMLRDATMSKKAQLSVSLHARLKTLEQDPQLSKKETTRVNQLMRRLLIEVFDVTPEAINEEYPA